MQPRRVGGSASPRVVTKEIEFKPLPKQREFLESSKEEILYSGAFGAGKSRIGCEKGYWLSTYYPGNVGLIVRKTLRSLKPTTLKTFLEEVVPPEHIVEHKKSESLIVLKANEVPGVPWKTSEVYYMGLDDPLKVGSMNLGWVFFDEAVEGTLDDWMMLHGRLRLNRVPFHQIFSATNPGPPGHWLYKRFFEEKRGHVIPTDAFQNPHNPKAYIERLKGFTGPYYDRYVLGKWVGFEGLVYPEFDPVKHVVTWEQLADEPALRDDERDALLAHRIPERWLRWRAIDFGTRNPFVCQWYAQNPRTRQYVMYREVYMTGRTVGEHGAQIQELSRGEDFIDTFADHDLDARLLLEDMRIHTSPANKEVSVGIDAARTLLKDDPDTRLPGVVFVNDALAERDPYLEMERLPKCTIEEFGGYIYAKGTGGTFKDAPAKKHDHGMDAYRYFAIGVAGPAPVELMVG